VTQVIERVKAHYEVEAVEMGTVYRWCPESVVIERDCGQSFTVESAKAATCLRCSADHKGVASRLPAKPLTAEEEAHRPTRGEHEACIAWMKDEGSHRRHSEPLYAGGSTSLGLRFPPLLHIRSSATNPPPKHTTTENGPNCVRDYILWHMLDFQRLDTIGISRRDGGPGASSYVHVT
jgi:hypothetical protein